MFPFHALAAWLYDVHINVQLPWIHELPFLYWSYESVGVVVVVRLSYVQEICVFLLLRTLLSIYIYIYIHISVLQKHPGMERGQRAHDGGDLPYEEPWQGMALAVLGLCCVYGEIPARKKCWGPLMTWYTD